jgi:signal transduction histidine kinase/CheY-like chemotaxis protein
MKTRTPIRFENYYEPYDRWFEISVHPADSGGLSFYVRDIHERKHAETLLRDADRHKDEFLATLAHELRNPLAPIRMGLEVMKIAADDPDVVAEIRDTMERQTHQLIRLVDDLLDISRITRGKLELRTATIELATVIESAVEATRPLIESLGHELVITLPENPITLEGDPTRLAQVFANLLNNAAKYTDQHGRIELAAEQHDGMVTVTVRDNGIGIPDHLLGRIFDMFIQVDRSLERRFSGLGIGLTLVKRLVEMHGGSIAVQSDGLHSGSTFIVTLPVLTAQTIQQRADAVEIPQKLTPVKRRILVVDDNEDAARTLAMMLDALGNQTRIAYNGLEAVTIAEEFRPEVIVMDIGMPGLNGYEAAERIRAAEWGGMITLIALTGWGQETDKQRSQEAGFDHHLTKPTEPAVLEALLVEIGE